MRTSTLPPDVCTSLIVDKHLAGKYRMWAVVAAFGDNLVGAALRAAQPLRLDRTELARLHELGDCLNYNAYGESLDDLHYHPADLYRTLATLPAIRGISSSTSRSSTC